jgi:hypothetical protein
MNFFHFYSCHQICFNFFCVHFLKTFLTDLKSAYNSAFLIPFLAKKRSKILKAYLVKCVLDFSFAPIIGVWVLNFSCSSNSLYPIVQIVLFYLIGLHKWLVPSPVESYRALVRKDLHRNTGYQKLKSKEKTERKSLTFL